MIHYTIIDYVKSSILCLAKQKNSYYRYRLFSNSHLSFPKKHYFCSRFFKYSEIWNQQNIA